MNISEEQDFYNAKQNLEKQIEERRQKKFFDQRSVEEAMGDSFKHPDKEREKLIVEKLEKAEAEQPFRELLHQKFEEDEKRRKTLKVHLMSQSKPIEYFDVKNSYTKEGLFCIYQRTGIVHKYPMIHIFRIEEVY